MSFFEHIATRIFAICRLMVHFGPLSSRHCLLISAIHSALPGSEVWTGIISKEVYSKPLAQRLGVSRVTSAYVIVLEPVVIVITGVISIAFYSVERRSIYFKKVEGNKEANY